MDLDEKVKRDLAPLEHKILGAILWGSRAKSHAHAGSDIDLCLVAGERPIQEVLSEAWRALPTPEYDVRVFEELPLYLKGEALDHGRIVLARDPVRLSEYLRPHRRLWEDQAARRHRTPEDLERILEARRRRLGLT